MKKELQVRGHVLFIMKVSLVHLFATLLFISVAQAHETVAQVLDTKISVELKEVTLRKALETLEEATQAKFLYQSNLIASSERISLHVTDERLADVLEKILAPRHIAYEADGNQIILTRSRINAIPVEALPEKMARPVGAVTVTGMVMDDVGTALPGVNVLLKGTATGTTTDAEGKYSLTVPDETAVLIFSFIGFTQQEISVGTQTRIDVTLQSDITSLNEIVVVGYGEVKKSDLTGSVASVKSEELNAFPTTNVMQSLSGRAAGVQISPNTGAPGGAISVRVRGANSIFGSNEPLYVVDGFPYSGNPTLLNNADIESIDILKDASATAIYGSRGANGVVLITTKRGKAGKTVVEYDGYYGFQSIRNKLDLMDAHEYAATIRQRDLNDGITPKFTQEEVDAFGKGTDWQDEVFRTAPIQNHAISVKGGTDKTRFLLSGSNFDQEGIIRGSNYVRNSVRANVTTDVSSKFKFDLNAILSRIDSDRKNSGGGNRGASLISSILTAYPTLPARTETGALTDLRQYSWASNVIVNPLDFIENENDHIRSNKVLANGAVTYTPIPGLAIKISGGIENTNDRTDIYRNKKFLNSTGSAQIQTAQTTTVLNENTVTYTREFGAHNISAVAGITYQNYQATSLNANGAGFISDTPETYDIQSAAQGNSNSSYQEWTLASYLARVNYSFRGKYLATASFRTDGSSRYSKGEKWGNFPSASLAWRISEEPFMQDVAVVSDLKLRAGYGETGSTAIEPYQTLNVLTSGRTVFNDAIVTSYAPGTRQAGPLKWETTAQTNIGIDLGLLQNRIGITLDYYVKNTRDLLNPVSRPASTGYSNTIQNIGKVQNKGVEIGANAVVLEGNFKWDVSGNISFNRNKVVSLYGGKDINGEVIGIAVVNDVTNILREGEPMGVFFGYVESGYDANGNPTYYDYNDSKNYDIGDKRITGDPNPDFIYGFNSTMAFRNFELGIFIQGSQGNDILNLSRINQAYDYGQGLNMPRDVYQNTWTEQNPTAAYPKMDKDVKVQMSDRFVEDGSYMRFKNIQLGYNVPVSALNITWLSRAKVYVSAQNLITITDYSWYDPEISSYGSANSYRQGIDHYSYPTAKTFTVGVNLGF
jgi:TonB-linked SusC/RagA family outer membrane protein